MKGFMLSFHQRFYEPHSNSESVQKHLRTEHWFLQNDSGSWLECFLKLLTVFNKGLWYTQLLYGQLCYWEFCGNQIFPNFCLLFPPGTSLYNIWLSIFATKNCAYPKVHIKNEKRGIKLTVGLILDQRQPSLVVIGQWDKLIYIHASCFQAGKNAYIQTLTDNSRRAEILIQIQTCSSSLTLINSTRFVPDNPGFAK